MKAQSVYAKGVKLASLAAVTIMSLYLILSGLIIGNVQEEVFIKFLLVHL
ncbi:hypothetical protein [Piscibacillus salipiscarius]|nr:hypothetical protein [Piscibacillus salipiscarius]